jgi:hypothetical protein
MFYWILDTKIALQESLTASFYKASNALSAFTQLDEALPETSCFDEEFFEVVRL